MDNKQSQSEAEKLSGSVSLLKNLESYRIQDYIKRKSDKKQLKGQESTEEKRARRLREKIEKEKRRRERSGWDDNEYQHYTNEDNPFGDSNLTSTFVWNKKLEKEGLRNVSLETLEHLSRRKQLENKIELDKVKKRRHERELEQQSREDDLVMQQRTREAAQFEEWEKQEDLFHLEQARLRSIIRIQDRRAKPIDLLAQYKSNVIAEDSIEMQMHEPYFLLDGLNEKDLEDLLEDIKVYLQLEKGENSDFWNDMTIIAEDELQKLRKHNLFNKSDTVVCNRREGIHYSVANDVSEIFRGKSTCQLNELQSRIEAKIKNRSEGIDISYWESLRSQLRAHMARSRLRDRHNEMLRQKLITLKNNSTPLTIKVGEKNNSSFNKNSVVMTETDNQLESINAEFIDCFDIYTKGNYSPKYIDETDAEPYITILRENEDEKSIHLRRLNKSDIDTHSESLSTFNREARKGMLEDEAQFSVEVELSLPIQLSSDKYRPRKPRYFNRVHTGFEWNKYNQTHYDMDNPPPKIVQGYKFNIFYPDLIDKCATPEYYLLTCEDNADFAILRFHVGPPYEDIAFKIVNREWEFSYKRGFRCQFHNNIFQLWFHFKRYRYRR